MNRVAIGGALIAAMIAALLFLDILARSPGASAPMVPAPRRVPSTTTPAAAPIGDRVAPRDAGGPNATGERRLLRLVWGKGSDQVGRRGDPESAAEGPMSLAAGLDGTLYLLDQVNGRVLRRDRGGRFGAPIVLGVESAQELRPDTLGGLTVLDRLGQKSLSHFGADGKLLEERALSAVGVVDPGGTTGLYEDEAGALYVEESLQAEGRRVLRPVAGGEPLPGRPSRDGSQLLAAAILERAAGRLVVRGLERTGSQRWQTPLSVERTILGIILCDSDPRGDIYVAVLHAATSVGSHDLGDERMELFRLRSSGQLIARRSVSHPPSELESFRELTIAGEGMLWWMHPLPDGSGMAIDELSL